MPSKNSTTKSHYLFVILIVFILPFIASCKTDKTPASPEKSYIEAMKKLKDSDYLAASEDFEKINDEYPLSKWATKAQIMAAYSFYKEEKYLDVIRISEQFATNNPSSPEIAYMQYLKAISYFDQLSDIKRSQDNAILASSSFRELIARFGNSTYVADAKEKLLIVEENIAGAKMNNGRYQMQTGNYIGAIKNFQDVIDHHFLTNQAPEAYFRIYEINQTLGLTEEATKYLQMLNKLYPQSQWAKALLTKSISQAKD